MSAHVGTSKCPVDGAYAIVFATSHDARVEQIRHDPTTSHEHRILLTFIRAGPSSHERSSSYARGATNILTERRRLEHDRVTLLLDLSTHVHVPPYAHVSALIFALPDSIFIAALG